MEQKFLRGALGIGTGDATADAVCGLCGRTLPEALLVAAHVKPRGECTDAERLDLPHVGMPACLLGCDALYERGLLSVGADGLIIVSRRAMEPPDLASHLKSLEGMRSPAWTAQREPYFAWHRSNRFRP